MTLHREGTTIILGTLISVAALGFITNQFVPFALLKGFIWLVLLVVTILVVQFFRVPKRTLNCAPNDVVSPADGKVVAIEVVEETEFLKQQAIQLSVFMSPLNVHANWFPIAGNVVFDKYHPGKFLVAWHPKSSTENERTTIAVKHANGSTILFRQIAGAVARRIKYYAKTGDQAKQAGEFGFIKFGSRVDVFLPVNTDIKVKIGDKVKGIETVLATLQ